MQHWLFPSILEYALEAQETQDDFFYFYLSISFSESHVTGFSECSTIKKHIFPGL